ncbi:DUF2924 domain-containing protein [Entomobacter blattae]|uniref:DUF2924 domain-containing protein n=1 Tax=Entomobacter blattae TaxID=2762277 RepID=A0A7H1NNP7_9PROT|nr:DUF2924 domain-containing protein [Entomobacter blattae]QNT77407.1 hypothetical protein JGUZn3_01410 [Entomobacter blattae]
MRKADIEPDQTAHSDKDRTELCTLWTLYLRRSVPSTISTDLLRRIITYEEQAKTQGGLGRKEQKALLGQHVTHKGRRTSPALKPGSRLMREWQGVVHHVDITEGGCLYQGASYPSLSAVAQTITGPTGQGPDSFGWLKAGKRNKVKI